MIIIAKTLPYLSQYSLMSEEWKLVQKKGKEIPLQAWTGLEGSWRLKFPDFKTIGTRW
jgi:hypothetical protein